MLHSSLANTSLNKVSDHEFAILCFNELTGEKSLHAAVPFSAGDLICRFEKSEFVKSPTKYTVQVDDHKHILLNPSFLQYINHHCSPNVFLNTTTREVLCLADIREGDEFTFFYPSTEWAMVNPFACTCNSAGCIQNVKGASYLASETLSRYKVTDFIMRKYLLSKLRMLE